MKTYFALVSLEIKLMLRSKSFWIIACLSIICILLPLITLLLGQFILIYQFTRDERTNISDIMQPLLYNAGTLCLARASAGFLMLLFLWPFMLIVLMFLPELKMAEWALMPGILLFLTLKYITICLIQVGLVFLFRIVSRNILLLYFLSIAWWIITSNLASNLSFLPNFFQLFVFGQGFMLPSAPSLAMGYLPLQDIFPYYASFQAGAAVLFIILFALKQLYHHKQPILHSKLLMVLFIFSLTAMYIGSSSALKELDHRDHNFNELLQTYDGQQELTSNAAVFVPESYNLTAKLKTSSHYFYGTAIINGKVSGKSPDKISFTLRNYFSVTSVSDTTTDAPLKWQQQGASLLVYLPEGYKDNQPLTLSISYSGEVWEWFPDRVSQPTNGPVNFIAAPYSLLRSGYAWYPVPGDHNLYGYCDYINPVTDKTQHTLRAKRVVHQPLPFSMTVDIDTDNTVVSNLDQTAAENLSGEYKHRYKFYSETGHNVFLLAGPYERQVYNSTDENVTVYGLPIHKGENSRVINSLADTYSFYKDMLQNKNSPNDKNVTIIEIPPTLLVSTDGESRKDLTLTDSILLSENYFKSDDLAFDFLNQIQANKRDIAVLQRWWQEDLSGGPDDTDPANNICSSLSYYLYILGLEKTRSPEFYTLAKQNIQSQSHVLLDDFCMPWLPVSSINREVFSVLDMLRTECGDQYLKKVIRDLYYIYTQQGYISADDFSKTIGSELTDSAISPEKQAEVRKNLSSIKQITASHEPIKVTPSMTQFTFDLEEYLP